MMKTIIFSDTHLTKKFDKRKFAFLKEIIQDADQVIINGDFWEGFTMLLEEFLNTEWKKLLILLGKKKTIYIIGNHDAQAKDMDHLFPGIRIKKDRYVFERKGKRYIVQHGDSYRLTFQHFIPLHLNENPTRLAWITQSYIFLENLIVRNFGKNLLQQTYRVFNNELKRQLKKEAQKDDIFIFGHTHAAEIDLANQFANSGIIRHGLAQYLELTEEGLSHKEVWYHPPLWRQLLFSTSRDKRQ